MEFNLSDFPTFEEGESFTRFRQKFFHSLAKSNLKEITNDDNWDFADFNCLLDWVRHTLIWQSLSYNAKKAAASAGLNPRYNRLLSFERYAQELNNFFENIPPRNHYEEYFHDVYEDLYEDNAIELLFSGFTKSTANTWNWNNQHSTPHMYKCNISLTTHYTPQFHILYYCLLSFPLKFDISLNILFTDKPICSMTRSHSLTMTASSCRTLNPSRSTPATQKTIYLFFYFLSPGS